MKKQLLRAAATTVLGLSLTTGFAAADVSNTGPHSTNKEINTWSSRVHVRNNNTVNLSNHNSQNASTGKATVNDNTNAGDATSGDASNDNSLDASVSIDNSGSGSSSWSSGAPSVGGSSIDTTGPHSSNLIVNKVSNTVDITNTNNLRVTNSNTQTAKSGSATVNDNTNGGSATSGSASNSNSSSFTLNVSN